MPDLDNLIKFVLDALNERLYRRPRTHIHLQMMMMKLDALNERLYRRARRAGPR